VQVVFPLQEEIPVDDGWKIFSFQSLSWAYWGGIHLEKTPIPQDPRGSDHLLPREVLPALLIVDREQHC
jgi:hypothetical protein